MADLMKDTYQYSALKKKYGEFMVPCASVSVGGVDIIKTKKLPVSDLRISMGTENASSASFAVHDVFDLKARKVNGDVKSLFRPGSLVSVKLGYGSVSKTVFYGYIADITTEFAEDPVLMITALDVISLIQKRERRNYTYQSKNYSEILSTMLSEYPKCYKSLEIDKTNDSLEIPIQNGRDMDYIRKVICRNTGKQFMVLAGKVYLRDFDDVSKPIMELEWGSSFLSFTESKVLVNEKYVFCGQEKNTKKTFSQSEKAESDSLAAIFKGKPIEIVSDPKEPVRDSKQAKELAKAAAKKAKARSMSGRGKTIGLPEIVPGRYIKISNIGSSNTYYIKSVSHSFGEGGFTTDFELGYYL